MLGELGSACAGSENRQESVMNCASAGAAMLACRLAGDNCVPNLVAGTILRAALMTALG